MSTKYILEMSPDIIFRMDAEGVITYVNASWRRILGHTADAVVGRRLLDFVAGEDAKRARESCRLALKQKVCVEDIEMSLTGLDGKARVLRAYVIPSTNGTGGSHGAICVLKDPEEARRIEDYLIQAQKMETIGTLAGGIAHDINNILCAISGHIELAGRNTGDAAGIEKHLSRALKLVERGREIAGRILAFSRQGCRQEGRRRERIHVAALVRDSVELLRPSVPPAVAVKCNCDGIDPTITGNAAQIYQVLMNLFMNAVRAMEDAGGTLTVDLSTVVYDGDDTRRPGRLAPGEYVKVRVGDTGSGISPDVIDRIFDPFFTTRPGANGTGMGLSIAQNIARQHGGDITVESTPGEGSVFKVYLPSDRSVLLEERLEREKDAFYRRSIGYNEESIGNRLALYDKQ